MVVGFPRKEIKENQLKNNDSFHAQYEDIWSSFKSPKNRLKERFFDNSGLLPLRVSQSEPIKIETVVEKYFNRIDQSDRLSEKTDQPSPFQTLQKGQPRKITMTLPNQRGLYSAIEGIGNLSFFKRHFSFIFRHLLYLIMSSHTINNNSSSNILTHWELSQTDCLTGLNWVSCRFLYSLCRIL